MNCRKQIEDIIVIYNNKTIIHNLLTWFDKTRFTLTDNKSVVAAGAECCFVDNTFDAAFLLFWKLWLRNQTKG